MEPTSGGNMSALITASGSPPARIISRSTLLRSWRTLPGQSCDCSTAMASSPIRRLGSPVACEIWCMKYSIRLGISSRRSANGGTRIGTTESR